MYDVSGNQALGRDEFKGMIKYVIYCCKFICQSGCVPI